MKEAEVQRKIKKRLEENGYFVTKIIQSSTNGFPDMLAIKEGNFFLIEIKKEGGKLSKLQEYRIKQLSNYGASIIITHNINGIDSLCK